MYFVPSRPTNIGACPSTREGTTLFNHSVLFTFKVTFLGCSVLSGSRLSPPLKLMPFVLDNTLFLGRSPPSFILRRCSTSRKGLSPCGARHTSLQSTLSRRLELIANIMHGSRCGHRRPTRRFGHWDGLQLPAPVARKIIMRYNYRLQQSALCSVWKKTPFLPPTELRP